MIECSKNIVIIFGIFLKFLENYDEFFFVCIRALSIGLEYSNVDEINLI